MDILDLIVSLMILIIMELVLGIDNLVFLSILTEKLPKKSRPKARQFGLLLAMITRLIFLASAVWLAKLTHPFISISHLSFSVRDLFLLSGGVFLIVKATQEIHEEMELHEPEDKPEDKSVHIKHNTTSFHGIVFQIALMDIIFSFDSVLTAIGLTTVFWVMAVAIIASIIMMIYASTPVGNFIEKHPSIKMLALSFLILIGTVLVADGFSFHVPRGYVYFAMGFSLGVETLNLIKRTRAQRVTRK